MASERRPTIVAADDEPAVLATMARDLRRGFGERYRIVRAGSGGEGLDLLRRLRPRGDNVALPIADQRMPAMRGTDYLVETRELVPDAKRVVLTAYADTQAARSGVTTTEASLASRCAARSSTRGDQPPRQCDRCPGHTGHDHDLDAEGDGLRRRGDR